MRRSLTFAALLICSNVYANSTRPQDAAEAFYRWVLAHPSVSLPSAAQRKELEPLLMPRFLALLAAAANGEQRCSAFTPPDLKPPIYEGSLFVGHYEGATEAAYGEPGHDGRDVYIDVDLMSIEPRWPKGHQSRAYAWRDRVKLQVHGRQWRVADVGMEGRSLTAELQKYVDVVIPDCLRRYMPAGNKPRP
jgi:hypothetical protein